MLSQIVAPLVDTQIRRLANSQATYSTLIETVAKWLSYLGVKAQVTHLAHRSGKIQISLTVGKPYTCSSRHWQQILDNLDQRSLPSSAVKQQGSSEEVKVDSVVLNGSRLYHKGTMSEGIPLSEGVLKDTPADIPFRVRDPLGQRSTFDRQQASLCLNSYDQISPAQRSKLQRLFAYLIQNSELSDKHNPDALSNFLYQLNLDEFMILGIRCALKVPQPIERLLRELDPNVIALAVPQAMKIALCDQKLNQEAETTINTMLRLAKSSSNNTFSLKQPGNKPSDILH